eukprot:TRINITY_DN44161_c0_g1_i1.p1 TRINITY_DN44161_c0_g1~~TRINITY_DN44161_c0_g1_i1.p1  ORF type:complete len:195 (-),score=58.43 TRINITY_DN44161_c0_g1_i1:320-904(-)
MCIRDRVSTQEYGGLWAHHGTMFFLVHMQANVELQPQHFHKKHKERLVNTLIKEKEGSFMGEHGYLVLVTKVHSIGSGKVRDGIAAVSFPIEYQALVFRPMKNEVVYGVVKEVQQHGFFATVGPLDIFISKHQIPPEYELDPTAQPQAFVSTEDPSARIVEGSEMRIKLVGVRLEVSEMVAIGKIAEDYLGPLQ